MRRVIPAMLIWSSVFATSSMGATLTFQQGVGGYTGTVDTFIQSGSSANNSAVDPLTVDGIPPATDERQVLIRFDNIFGNGPSQVPLGATNISATLMFNVSNSIAIPVTFNRMLQSWNPVHNWADYGLTPWNGTAGIQADGSEALASADASPASVGTGLQSITVTSGVLAWQANPSTNFGWVIRTAGADSLVFDSSEVATATNRPRLTVNFDPPSTCSVTTDCHDGSLCTTDTCNTGTSTCEYTPVTCPGGTCNLSNGQCEAVLTFQQGVNGYSEARDTFLNAASTGTTHGTATTLSVDGPGDDAANARHTLLHFRDIFGVGSGQIPTGSTILSATLTLYITNGSANGASFHRMLQQWSDVDDDTWTSWGTGIQANGVEAVSTADISSFLNSINVAHAVNVTTSLAAWSAGAANHGWALLPNGDDSWQFTSAEGATVAQRPLLTVTYEPPSSCDDDTDCNDGTTCTIDTCNIGSGECVYTPITCPWGACNSTTGQCEVTLTFRDGVGDYAAGSTQDTYFDSATPTTNQGAGANIFIDGDPSVRQGLFRFDGIFGSNGSTRIPPGSTIRSATLTVYTNDASDTGAALHRMLACWSESDTWNTFTSGVQADGIEAVVSPDVPSTFNNTINSSHVITVTSSLVAWSAGAVNLGWAFLPLGGSGWGLDSSEGTNKPLLTVTFTPPVACTLDVHCDDGNGCTDDTCNTGTGFCTNTVDTGNSCSDAVACTNDACSPCGRCVSVDGCTTPAVCNISNGQCEVPPAAPNQPTSPSPAQDATGVSSSPQLCVDVSDPDGGVLDVTFHGRQVTSGGAGDPFTIIALPDTQFYSRNNPPASGSAATAIAQMQWIRDNRVARNIVAVTELGDCVNDADQPSQWANAHAAHLVLEDPGTTGLVDGIPYGICVGNHDQTPFGSARSGSDENVTTAPYNATFPKSRFAGRAYHGGNYPLPGFADSMDNHYELFSGSGMDFIVFHFEWDEGNCTWPSNGSVPTGTLTTCQNVLSWARDLLINTYPNRRAILTAHFMGTPSSGGTGTLALSNQGQAIINMAKGTPNVFLTLGGHLDQADSRTDLANDGHTIHTWVSDYQSRPGGGNGWLRIMTFDPQADTIRVETYSPTLGRYINKLADGTPNNHADNLAAPENEFTVTYDMDDGGPFTVIDAESTASLSPGAPATVCVTWPSLTTGEEYEWYVTVEDSTSLLTTGPRWFFTTAETCAVAGDCNDADLCTADTCPAGTCVYTPIGGCCLVDADCTDGDPCTVEQCVSNACTFPPIVGCCDTSADCNDLDPCTTDFCNLTSDNFAALVFDGTNDYVTMGAAPGLNAESFTVEFWLRWTGANPGPTVSSGTGGIVAVPVVCKGGPEADNSVVDANYFIGLRDAGGGNWTLAADFEQHSTGSSPGLNHPTTGATVVPANEWHHAAIVYDRAGSGTGTWRLYLDGELDGTLFVGQPPNFACTQHFALGTSLTSGGVPASSGGTGYFRGSLDEVRVWNVARSQAEIQANMGKELTSGIGLVGRWGLEEGSGTTTIDSIAPQENGTLTGGPTWQTTPANLVTLGDLNECIYTPNPNCCVTAAECDESDFCTDDDCVANLCVNTPIGGCCHTVADCNDADFCTTDSCVANVCDNDFITECCHDDPDCDDGNVCTVDDCPPGNLAALSFDGVDDHVTLGSAASLNNFGTGSFTIEGWFYTNGGNANLTGLVRFGRQGAFPQIAVQLSGSGAPFLAPAVSVETNTTGTQVDVNNAAPFTTVTPNAWHHFALIADRSTLPGNPAGQQLRLHIDGGAAITTSASVWASNIINPTDIVMLGAARDAAGAIITRYDGRLDEVRVWDTVRTPAEITANMFSSISSAPGLRARWGMDEGTGTLLDDSAGSNDGTLIGGTSWSTTDLPNFASANLCTHTGVPGCCNVDGDCDDGNLCTTDTCVSNACSNAPVPNCCNTVADCNDANACTTDTCISNQCGHSYAPTPGCCSLASHCNDGNVCTNDACGVTAVPSNVSSLAFDGVNDYVTMGAATGTSALGATTFTLEAWIYMTGSGVATATGGVSGLLSVVPIITKGRGEGDGSNIDCNYHLGLSGGKLAADFEQIGIASGTGQNIPGLNRAICGSTTITTNTWHHVAAVYDGCWKLYLNGVPETLTTACVNPSGPVDVEGACPLHSTTAAGTDNSVPPVPRFDSIQHFGLGTAMTSTGAAAGFFAGRIDEARVWNVARTQAEIQAAMSQELTSGTGLIGRWGLNENVGLTAADSAGPNIHNGTLTNGPVWTAAPPPALTSNTSACENTPVTDGTTCNDGEFCTDADNCVGGVCTSSTPHDCDDGLTCTTDHCDDTFDWCTNTLNAGSCLVGGVCYSGGTLNPGNDCEFCDSVANPTGWTPRASGSSCGNAATTDCDNPDTCNGSGACLANHVSNGSMCTDDANDCTNDVCSAGLCTHPPRAAGLACGDGTFTDCNNPDTCNGAGVCLNNHAPNGTGCNDGLFCTDGATCTAGLCGNGSPHDCADGISCTADLCNENLNICENPIQAGFCLIAGLCVADGSYNPLNECQWCDDSASATNWSPVPGGVSCGSGVDTDCDNPDTCNGAGGCIANNEPNGTNCTDEPNDCTNDTCNAGVCTHTALANGEACDDGNACTTTDVCNVGICAGSDTSAVDCNDGNACTNDSCHPISGCQNTPSLAGTPCGSPADTSCSNPDTCDGFGVCAANHEPDGTPCPDGVFCNGAESCQGGVCAPGTPVPACCTLDSECSNGDVCDGLESCVGNACVAGTPLNCDDSNVCTDDFCDEVTGCFHTPNTASCDDGEVCTTGDTCSATMCMGGPPPSCADGNLCTQNICVPGVGCTNPPTGAGTACGSSSDTNCDNPDTCNGAGACLTNLELDGTSCADGLVCNGAETCQSGLCSPGTPLPSPPCCEGDLDCDDGNVCNGLESCVGNVCMMGTSLNCNDGNVCTNDSCNQISGCQNVPNSAPCSDGNGCTTVDVCSGGFCNPGPPIVCNDFNDCTDDSCSPVSGCVYDPNDDLCDDGNACTTGDQCAATVCSGIDTSAIDCNDGNPCTNDSCNPLTGCAYVFNTSPCSDGNACTTNDTCNGAGVCMGGSAPVCNDGNLCTDDSCVPATGCLFVNNAATCNDGNACTINDACSGGACIGGPAMACNDNNPCTDDACDSGSGCVYVNNTAPCSDLSVCTTVDVCIGGSCVGSTPLNCNDSNACTTDSCDPTLGCQYGNVPSGTSCGSSADTNCDNPDTCDGSGACAANSELNGTPCPDGVACNGAETCQSGVCTAGSPPPGCCEAQADCEDNSVCTGAETCVDNVCVPGTALNCDDGNPCTDDTCHPTLGCQYASNSASCDDGDACTTNDQCAGGPITRTFQQGFSGYTQASDTYIDAALASQATATLIVIDNSPVQQALLRFDSVFGAGPNQVPPGATISSATLTLWVGSNTNDQSPNAVNFHRLLNAWNHSDVWAAYGLAPWNATAGIQADGVDAVAASDATVTMSTLGASANIDVTLGVQGWAANPASNYGWVILPTGNDGLRLESSESTTASNARRPRLTVQFTAPICVGGPPAVCNDSNACTDDTCNTLSGCQFTPNTSPCNDGNACTTNDTCNGAGTCVGGPSPNCNDGNPCTNDSCNPVLGCQNVNNTAPCNDNNACTTGDTCSGGSCSATGTLTCNDGNLCTTDSCVPATGCQFANNTLPCSDGLFCTAGDSCSGGGCVGGASPCTLGQVCDEGADACITTSSPPTVSGAGSRYLAITPPAGLSSVALRVESASVACLPRYVSAAGLLVDTPVFQTSASWGTIRVGDEEVIPLTSYDVRSDVRLPAEPVNLSVPATAATWLWGDANNNGSVNIFDIVCVLDGFQATFTQCTLYGDDLMGTVPNRAINIFDIVAVLDAFSGLPYPDADPCALPRDGNVAASLPVAQLRLRPSRTRVAAGGTVSIDVYLDNAVELRGYQLAVEVSSTVPGSARLIDTVADATRKGFVFANEPHYATKDLNRGRIAAATLTQEFRTSSPAYLATFVFQVSPQGSGMLEFTLRGGEESMLLVDAVTAMEISKPSGIVIEVVGDALDNSPKVRRSTSRAAQ